MYGMLEKSTTTSIKQSQALSGKGDKSLSLQIKSLESLINDISFGVFKHPHNQ